MNPTARTALITGGAVRLGREIARGLAASGARVIVHYHRSEAEAHELVGALRADGREAEAIGADLSDLAAVDRLADEADGLFGGVDILVNNASIFPPQGFEEVTSEVWERTMAVNLRAPFFLTQRLGARMRARGAGVVINLADLAGVQSWAGYAAHGISKAALVHLTRVAARALAPQVRVAAIAPGTVLPPESMDAGEIEELTRRIPLGRIGAPPDVVDAVLYLVRAEFVTGEVLTLDGGRRLLG